MIEKKKKHEHLHKVQSDSRLNRIEVMFLCHALSLPEQLNLTKFPMTSEIQLYF